jgi:hypothetical protein
MAGLSAREAGNRVGLSKQAILKAIHKGTISAVKDEAGEWRIEPAELFRVYPATATDDGNQPATDEAAGLRREIAFRDEKLALLERQLADLRADRDEWRGQAQQALRLLPAPQPEPRRGWWRRLRGK